MIVGHSFWRYIESPLLIRVIWSVPEAVMVKGKLLDRRAFSHVQGDTVNSGKRTSGLAIFPFDREMTVEVCFSKRVQALGLSLLLVTWHLLFSTLVMLWMRTGEHKDDRRGPLLYDLLHHRVATRQS